MTGLIALVDMLQFSGNDHGAAQHHVQEFRRADDAAAVERRWAELMQDDAPDVTAGDLDNLDARVEDVGDAFHGDQRLHHQDDLFWIVDMVAAGQADRL